jgi:hypothetical protein
VPLALASAVFLGPSPLGLATVFYCLRFETSLYVASYDSQGHGGGIQPRLHTGISLLLADTCYIASARTTQKTQFYCCVAQTTQKTSHVITKHCLNVASLRLRGSVFTEPLLRNGLHNPVVPLLLACIAECFSSHYLAVR